jgi:D-alanine-D-alanine ligase
MGVDKSKIAVLYDTWEEQNAEAVAVEEPARPKKSPTRKKKNEKKDKEDREEIFESLAKLGHEPFYHVLDGRTQSLHGLA